MPPEASDAQRLLEFAQGPPSGEAWGALCSGLGRFEEAAAAEVVASLRGPLARWPATLRRGEQASGDPAAPWLEDLGAGRCDPRLELLGQAALRFATPFAREGERLAGWPNLRAAYPLVVLLARALDPGFDPPDTLRSQDGEYFSANGCGGGFDEDVRGDEARGATWYDRITEHAADDASEGAWRVYGLPEGCLLEVGRYERGRGRYTFAAAGPCPAVLELALAWGALMRAENGIDLASARSALANARVPWRAAAPELGSA